MGAACSLILKRTWEIVQIFVSNFEFADWPCIELWERSAQVGARCRQWTRHTGDRLTTDPFFEISDRLLGEPGIAEGTGFGSNPGLRVAGKIFAMSKDRELIVKLPADRCAELVASGSARPFDRGQGRPLKEWVVVENSPDHDWFELATEALAFVRPKS
jgi:hypothetical protein